ncbi:MAG: DUF2027 domain-containing protein [Bacteroides sp.]|nr:DUF2027 domain-containing protein [Bacteroides sp.]MCM1094662.1 DUF2027 domain-containing protein [Terasakiella sp.]
MLNIGDTVRYLNATGGGTVTRIKDNLAYVADEDGFETPVLIKECVVVGKAADKPTSPAIPTAPQPKAAPASKDTTPAPAPAPESPEGERLSLILGFEAADLRHLSTTTFDATLVNLSNYHVLYSIATRERDADSWTLRAAGAIEPSTADFVFELSTADLPSIDRISVQAVAYKTGKDYTLKAPLTYEARLDATRFARLHSFRPSPYFDSRVLEISLDEKPVDTTPLLDMPAPKSKAAAPAHHGPARSKAAAGRPEIMEIDLHATELLESTAGMSASEILNYQIDYFRRIMDGQLRNAGQRIVFIHGNGDGVLRRALQKELAYRYKEHEVADASFREYGFGATMVTIRRPRR